MNVYVIVHTHHGYLTHYSMVDSHLDQQTFDFTKNMADAIVFTNLDRVINLCNRYMACAWVREDGERNFKEFYNPNSKADRDMIDNMRRNL